MTTQDDKTQERAARGARDTEDESRYGELFSALSELSPPTPPVKLRASIMAYVDQGGRRDSRETRFRFVLLGGLALLATVYGVVPVVSALSNLGETASLVLFSAAVATLFGTMSAKLGRGKGPAEVPNL
ncbi:MAG: hypothetical protein AAGE01_13770 [Pseudomonadota bacterium]